MSVHSILTWTMLAPTVLVLWLTGDRGPVTLLLTPLAVVLCFPWAVARLIAIPLGAVRPAWALGRLAEVVWRDDRAGGAALAAVWALARRRTPPVKLAVWVDRRLEGLRPLGSAGIFAAGLAASARGDAAAARTLIESLALVGRGAGLRSKAGRLAAEWLAAEAASRGAWEEARAHTAVAPTRAARLLGLLADRILGAKVPPWLIWLAWAGAPRRSATRPLVQRALVHRAPEGRPPAGRTAAAAPEGHPYRLAEGPSEDGLRAALRAHLRASASGPQGALGAVAAGWDVALADPATRRWVGERARAAGVRPDPALAALAAAVEEDLADLCLAAGEPVEGGGGPIAAGAARRMRERLLGEVEQAARSLASRVTADRALPAVHEWREALALRERLLRAGRQGGLGLRRLLFEDVHAALCPLACRLWNDRGQRLVADALFRFLLGEAEAVGNTRLAEHERKNVRA